MILQFYGLRLFFLLVFWLTLILPHTAGAVGDPCELPSCLNGKATTVKQADGSEDCSCVCNVGYTGSNCDKAGACVGHSPCYNDGECRVKENGEKYCECAGGYRPPNCRDRDPCEADDVRCLNGGTCIRLNNNDYSCACTMPFEGKSCEIKNLCNLEPDECLDFRLESGDLGTECFPCANNIRFPDGCVSHGENHYECICNPGWGGEICDKPAPNLNLLYEKLTLPIRKLERTDVQNYIALRILDRSPAYILVALKIPEDTVIRAVARITYRPNCEDIVQQWSRYLPTSNNDTHFIIPPMKSYKRFVEDGKTRWRRSTWRDQNPAQHLAIERHHGIYETGFHQRPEHYITLWPEDSSNGFSRVEVTVGVAVFTVRCVEIHDITHHPKYAHFELLNPCMIGSEADGSVEILCKCVDKLTMKNLLPYLEESAFALETYMPMPRMSDLKECSLVVEIVVGIAVVFVVILALMLIGHFRTKKRIKLVVNTSVDRILEETFYLVTVVTGSSLCAATTANLFLELHGTCGGTKKIPLHDSILTHTCRQNAEDHFLLSSRQKLGNLKAVSLWHDSSGSSPDWYCKRIVVQEIRSEQRWFFVVNRWMTLKDESLSQTIAVASEKEVVGLHRATFTEAFTRATAEQHLILAFLFRGPYSDYSHLAHWSVFCSLLFTQMLILLLLYGIPDDDEATPVEWEEYGPLRGIVIINGVIAALITIPFRLLFGFLFSRLVIRRVPTLIICCDEPQHSPAKNSVTEEERQLGKSLASSATRSALHGINLNVSSKDSASSQATTESFQIPSTSVSDTERWVAENKPTPSRKHVEPIRRQSDLPVRKRYKHIISDGIIGAMTDMKDTTTDMTNLVYRVEDQSDMDLRLAENIRAYYKHKAIAEASSSDQPSTLEETVTPINLNSNETGETAAADLIETSMDDNQNERLKVGEKKPVYVELCETEYFRLKFLKLFRLVLWFVVVFAIVCFAIVTGYFGKRYGMSTCMNWSYSFMWTCIISLLFASLFAAIIYGIIIVLILKCRKMSYETWLQKWRFRLVWLKESCIRPQMWSLNFINYLGPKVSRPITSYRICQMRMKARKRKRLRTRICDAVVFSVFIVCLIIAVQFSEKFWLNRFKHSVKHSLLADTLYEGVPFSIYSIQSAFDFYNYLKETFFASVYQSVERGGLGLETVKAHRQLNWLRSGVAFFLGTPRLRQQRVKPGICVTSVGTFKDTECNYDYEDSLVRSTKDTQSYHGSWLVLASESDRRNKSHSHSIPWDFTFSADSGSFYTVGKFASYDGGGYIANFQEDLTNNIFFLNELQESEWIDFRTRAIFLEFALYDPYVKICEVVVFLLEQSALGLWQASVQAETFYLRPFPEASNWYIVLLLVLLIVCTVYFIFRLAWNMQSMYRLFGVSSLNHFWLWIDFGVIASAVASLILFLLWNAQDKELGLSIAKDTDHFISFQSFIRASYSFLYSATILCLFTMIKCWILVTSSCSSLFKTNLTLKLSRKYLIVMVLCFLLLAVVFAAFSSILSGTSLEIFSTYRSSFLKFIMPPKYFSHVTMWSSSNRPIGLMASVMYLILIYVLLMGFTASILIAGRSVATDITRYAWKGHSFRPRWLPRVLYKLKLSKHKQRLVDSTVPVTKDQWQGMHVVSIALLNRHTVMPPSRIFHMRNFSRTIISGLGNTQRIISKDVAYRRKLARRSALSPAVRWKMESLTASLLRRLTGRTTIESNMKAYHEFNLTLLDIKCKRIVTRLSEIGKGVRTIDISPSSSQSEVEQ